MDNSGQRADEQPDDSIVEIIERSKTEVVRVLVVEHKASKIPAGSVLYVRDIASLPSFNGTPSEWYTAYLAFSFDTRGYTYPIDALVTIKFIPYDDPQRRKLAAVSEIINAYSNMNRRYIELASQAGEPYRVSETPIECESCHAPTKEYFKCNDPLGTYKLCFYCTTNGHSPTPKRVVTDGTETHPVSWPSVWSTATDDS